LGPNKIIFGIRMFLLELHMFRDVSSWLNINQQLIAMFFLTFSIIFSLFFKLIENVCLFPFYQTAFTRNAFSMLHSSHMYNKIIRDNGNHRAGNQPRKS